MSKAAKWAVITGASSGIGRALALEFARGGFHLLLTGRNAQALAAIAGECAGKFRVETQTHPADLASPDATDALVAAIAGKPHGIDVLVNNAGFGIRGEFSRTDVTSEIDLINVQLAATLKLTKAILPGMIARRSGRILNVGSVYCYAPVPFQSVYSACKAFLLSFSAAIRDELTGSGVTVTVFCPGITQTEFRARAGIVETKKTAGMTAEDAARVAYAETMRGSPVVIPGLANRLFALVGKILPSSSFTRVVRYINRKRKIGV
jgi:short-subunit dehydrogenase